MASYHYTGSAGSAILMEGDQAASISATWSLPQRHRHQRIQSAEQRFQLHGRALTRPDGEWEVQARDAQYLESRPQAARVKDTLRGQRKAAPLAREQQLQFVVV